MQEIRKMKEVRLRVEPKIYPLGQRGTILTGDLIEYIAKELKAKELVINHNYRTPDWSLNNMLIDNNWIILNAYYDTGTNEIILQLIKRDQAPCKFGLNDCIYANGSSCKGCTNADFYDDEDK